jgi:MinD-like ATPase involved in chromosome partitioning or flagellar assembly
MTKIIAIHSFRGGTGKSNIGANLAALLSQKGLRVGVVDTDIQSPGIHILFGLDASNIRHALNDYLWGDCGIQETAHDVSAALGNTGTGRVFLIPSSLKAGEIGRILRDGYEVSLLNEGFNDLIRGLKLDVLIIDTHPGLNEETLMSIAISDILLVLLRPDQQDYQGTSVTIEVARRLEVPKLMLLVNKVPGVYSLQSVRETVAETYQAEVAAVIPHTDEMMALASADIFAIRYPHHPVTIQLGKVAEKLIA